MNRVSMIALVLCLALVEPAIGCSCAMRGVLFEEQVAEAFSTATYVLLGEVASVESIVETHTLPNGRKGQHEVQLARIKVLRSWKGDKKAGEILLTRTTTTCCMCGWEVKAGQQLIVYAYGPEPVGLSYCSRTAVADLGSPDIPVIERILRGEPPLPVRTDIPLPEMHLPEIRQPDGA